MKLTAKTQYACLAMLELAGEFDTGEPVQLRRIAERHAIPQQFLVQILHQLKGAALVSSTRGASGGYKLAREPQAITLADVIDVIEGPARPAPGSTPPSPLCQALNELCDELHDTQRQRLENITLGDLVEQASANEPMWYI